MSFQTSIQPIIGKQLADAMLVALSTRPAAALLTTPTCHLFTSGPTPITPTNVPADFTEATFAGYAAIALGAFVGPINLPSGLGFGVEVDADFVAGAVVPPGQNIQGYWIDSGVGATTIYLAEYFPAPVPIAQAGDFVSIDNIFGVQDPVKVV